MEFKYLSELTGDAIYGKKVDTIRSTLKKIRHPSGLFYNFVNPESAGWCGSTAGLAALGDSFYEYLLKEWIRTNGRDAEARQLYDTSLQVLWDRGLFKMSKKQHLFVANSNNGVVNNFMEHLACFAGGMLALGAANQSDPWFTRGQQLTETCRLSYMNTYTHLGPEGFEFSNDIEAVAVKSNQKPYYLRPETVESYFYMWRFTKDLKYREWAWDVVQALQNYTRTPTGYSGLKNSNSASPGLDDVQQSYFLAETLKYLYLIFSEDTLLPLDRWVFNSEAHPLPIQGKVALPDET
ncbi:unnamed protein product [Calicophoron daubneyi]|uniref:Alpha-1,2-Mannosidase n=1 Tax=Calicophoron daubneyi TaxID=300641 RepID=A0AAV2T7U5_CALDB